MSSNNLKSNRFAFTVIELLVVIAIIGILTALTLPAVNSAREMSRVSSCQSNLRQLGLAMQMFEQSQRHYPSGGWGYDWVGFPDQQFQNDQSGAWGYSLLNYIDERPLFLRGPYSLLATGTDQELNSRLNTIVPLYSCPSRRGGKRFAIDPDCVSCRKPIGVIGSLTQVFRSDYAVNIGDGAGDVSDTKWPLPTPGPRDLEEAKRWTNDRLWPEPPIDWSGISYLRTSINTAAISDGSSNMLLMGEKYIAADKYFIGTDWGDNENAMSGFDNDNHRSTNVAWPLLKDTVGILSVGSFGSSHRSGSNFVYCDGAVQMINYSIDSTTYGNLGNRHDGRETTFRTR